MPNPAFILKRTIHQVQIKKRILDLSALINELNDAIVDKRQSHTHCHQFCSANGVMRMYTRDGSDHVLRVVDEKGLNRFDILEKRENQQPGKLLYSLSKNGLLGTKEYCGSMTEKHADDFLKRVLFSFLSFTPKTKAYSSLTLHA